MRASFFVVVVASWWAATVGAVRVGVGRADATPPVTGYVMMGMANPAQVGTGLHTRLFARAFVFVDDADRRAAFVSLDGGMVGHVMKKRVLAIVADELGDDALYTFENVALSGTHSHSGPSGFLQHVIFQFAGSGWVPPVLDAMVQGAARALLLAHADVEALRGGSILEVRRGTLRNASLNRSPSAYLDNPAAERAKYDSDTDNDFTVLSVVASNDEEMSEMSLVAWFAVHPTSMNNTNTLVSSDNKGLASLLMERREGSKMKKKKKKKIGVAAFASSNLGDVTPNILGPHCRDTGLPCDFAHSTCPSKSPLSGRVENRTEQCSSRGPGADMFASTLDIAAKQHDMAATLLGLRGAAQQEAATEAVVTIDGAGSIRVAHTFVRMPGLEVRDWESGAVLGVLCGAALGDGFAAGTIDGPGQFDFTQGAKSSPNPLWPFLSSVLHKSTPEERACQHPKTILLPTGSLDVPHAWAPSVLPMQVISVGEALVVAAVPSELTTMAGRRLKAMLRRKFPRAEVVVAGLANEYADYTTTPEEYEQQRYEAASTIFGPLQLPAFLDQYARLADSILIGTTLPAGPTPPDFSPDCLDLTKTPIVEAPPKGHAFGDVLFESWLCNQGTNRTVRRGTPATATFVSGDLKHDLRTDASYFDVERADDPLTTWRAVYDDADFETRVDSKKKHDSHTNMPWFEIKLRFDVPVDAPKGGRYRLVYHGAALTRSGPLKTKLEHFDAVSSEFTLV